MVGGGWVVEVVGRTWVVDVVNCLGAATELQLAETAASARVRRMAKCRPPCPRAWGRIESDETTPQKLNPR